MARTRLLILAALVVVALVSASTSQPATGTPTLDPQHLPKLPAQGLVVQRAHDTLLVGLDGKEIGSLAGFAGPYTGKTYVLEALAQADPDAVLLTDASHHAYLLDTALQAGLAAHRLDPGCGRCVLDAGSAAGASRPGKSVRDHR